MTTFARLPRSLMLSLLPAGPHPRRHSVGRWATRPGRGHDAGMNRKPLRVVVADDHPLYRQGVVRALEAGGELVVAEASDGATALNLIRRNPPDVALVDVRMPRMDGIDVVEDLT